MDGKIDIRSIAIEEIKNFFTSNNEKPFRGAQVYEWLWKKSAVTFEEMTNLSFSLRKLLEYHFTISPAIIKNIQESTDGTIKTAFTLHDHEVVEGVLIPSEQRATACISSQVGCALGCTFCATGKLKFKRNLSPGEIYDQVIAIKKQSQEKLGVPLSNIVLMGMGEPLLNYDNVLFAIDKLTSDKGLGLSPQRITLSTVGLPKMIKKLGDDKVKFNLAVSLHSANDQKRSCIMPLNTNRSLETLAESIRYFYALTGERVTFEYLLLNKFNDGLQDAKELALFCKNVPCKVNIIEYNTTNDSPFEKSTPVRTQVFVNFLESKNIIVNIRKSRGADIDAACGQLAGKYKK